MKTPLISIIIPIYNNQDYISNCIDTIRNQTYNNLEILIIDDGSTDNTPAICDEYAKKDTRIRVFHVPNGGAAYARNIALDNMKGEFVAFVDGDDYIDSHYLENLYNDIVKMQADIATCKWTNIYLNETGSINNKFKAMTNADFSCTLFSKTEALKELLYQVNIDSAMWAKLFKSTLFSGIRFPVGNMYEDLAIIYKVFEKAHKISHSTYGGYYYLIRSDGITLKQFTSKKMMLIDTLDELKNYLNKRYPKLKNAVASRVVRGNFHLYLQIPRTKEYQTYRKRIEKNIKSVRRIVLKDKNSRFGTKSAILISYFSFTLLFYLKNLKNLGKY